MATTGIEVFYLIFPKKGKARATIFQKWMMMSIIG